MPEDKAPDASSVVAAASIETGGAVAGALVGLVIGGPAGAVVGAAASPLLVRASNIAARTLARRQRRVELIVEGAIERSGLSQAQVLDALESDDERAEQFLALIREAAAANPGLGPAFLTIMSESLIATSQTHRHRLTLLSDAMKDLQEIDLQLLAFLSSRQGRAAASEIAEGVGIPVVELRGTVRGLELRGMIKDDGRRPVVWQLRELGAGIVHILQQGSNEERE